MYKLAFFDLDGTLLNSRGDVLPSSIDALKRLKENDIKLILTTGRSMDGVRDIIDRFNLEGLFSYYVYFNGSLIIDNNRNKIICDYNILSRDFKDIVKYANDNNINYYMVLRDSIVSEKKFNFEKIESSRNESPIVIQDFNDRLKIKKIVFNSSKSKIDSLLNFDFTKFNIIRLDDKTLEVMNKNAGKGEAFKKIVKMEKTSYDDTIAFGDSVNDSEMLLLAGFSCSMNNANLSVKEKSNHVTGDNNHDGISIAVDEILRSL